ncbi:MAG: hypothetical protein DRH50_14480 [Deltaproteobacteria bacterium]|nr:MAG: hypothetical protein DRH50_14480 [Deltaproteobacteria bacterium]
MNTAVLCKDTGRILYRSEDAGIDEVADQDLNWENCIEIPHKYDLNLGRELVFEFVEMYLPDEYYRVRQIFRKRGAYSRYKRFLESRGMLDTWYEFENEREEQALRQWCKENGIELSG